MIVAVHHASAFAEHFDRAGFSATAAKNIGVENAQRGAAKVAGADALDEARNIDMRGACAGAGRVETIQAAIGFNHGRLRLSGGLMSPNRSRSSRSSGNVAVLMKTSGSSLVFCCPRG